MKRRLSLTLAVLAGAIPVPLMTGLGTESAAAPEPGKAATSPIDPKSASLLHQMSDLLASHSRFAFRADGATEVITKEGERLEFEHSSSVRVKRPNALRSDRRGEEASADFYYDGQSFTLFGKTNKYYATAPAPPTLDEALDGAREKLGIEAPGADLLYSKPYQALTDDVVSGTYVGATSVRDVPCHHLAFRGRETDWQIWIEAGSRPLPHKLVIVSKKVAGAPEFRVELFDWNLAPDFDDDIFKFTPPPDAKKTDFRPLNAAFTPGQSRGTKK